MSGYFSGRVHSIIYENMDFYILRVVLDEKDGHGGVQVSVRGKVAGMNLRIGSWFGFEAKWENNPQYGRQLHIKRAPVIKDGWTTDTALATLQSNGVGPQVCQKLRQKFGDEVVRTLDNATEKTLTGIPGMTPFAAAHVLSRWKYVRSYYSTLDFLDEAGVPKSKISEVWKRFGEDAQDILTKNPWALVRIEGIRFEQVDEVGLRLDLPKDSPLRIQGAALYAVRNRRGMGHLFLSSGDMLAEIRELVSHAKEAEVAKALAELHRAGELIIDRTTRPGTTAIYDPWLYQLEKDCAAHLRRRMELATPTTDVQVEVARVVELAKKQNKKVDPKLAASLSAASFRSYAELLSRVGGKAKVAFEKDPSDYVAVAKGALEDYGSSSQIDLSADQLRGALNALVAPVSILTGLPGTGKTTTLKAVVSVLQEAGVPFLLCAPTGIAAKRMSSLTGAEASTIHRAFQARGWDTGGERESTYAGVVGESTSADGSDGSAEAWGYDENDPYPANVVICDEFSMVDQHLLYRLLTCTSPQTRLVVVGDPAQLPSVGPGNVLRDLIRSGQFPTVNLTEVYRQEETSGIVLAAHKTFRGEVPEYGVDKNSDFVFIEEQDEDAILTITTKLIERLHKKNADADGDDVETFQVLSPRHAGKLGVTNLNQRLRTVLNPQSPGLQEHRLGSETVREDDRVMVVKNRYRRRDGEDASIYNGDVGKIVRIDKKSSRIELKLHGPPVMQVQLEFKESASHLRLAYCVTVHKSQGQEYDVIVMPLVKGFQWQLQRNLFYTAITRAKKRVILIGHREALVKSVMNNREDVRNSLFPDRLGLAFSEGGSASEGRG